jgi:hypothetical protein
MMGGKVGKKDRVIGTMAKVLSAFKIYSELLQRILKLFFMTIKNKDLI